MDEYEFDDEDFEDEEPVNKMSKTLDILEGIDYT